MQTFALSAAYSCPGAPGKCLRFAVYQLSLAYGNRVLCPSGSVLISPPFIFPSFALDPLTSNLRALIAQSSGKALPFLSFVEKWLNSCICKFWGCALEDLGFLPGHFLFTPQDLSRQLASYASLSLSWQPRDALTSHGAVCGEGKHLFHVMQARLSQLLESWEHVCLKVSVNISQ